MDYIQKEEVRHNHLKLSMNHPCYGCPMYSRETEKLFCMVPFCIKKSIFEKNGDKNNE